MCRAVHDRQAGAPIARASGAAALTKRFFQDERGISAETLESFGVVIRPNGVVVLPYEGRLRERVDLPKPRADGKRFLWGEGDAPIMPFNVADASAKTVFITEGETDAMRLKQELVANDKKAGVIGLPGVESWKDEWAERFADAKKVYVVLDNPSGYDDPEQLERAWRKMRTALGGERTMRVYLTEGVKDVCEFLTRFGFPAFEHLVKEETTRGRRHWQPLDLTQQPEPTSWLWQDGLAYEQTNVLIGEAWGGKSFWYLGLVKALLAGERTYCGRRLNVSPEARVLVVDEENPPRTPIWRLAKLGLSSDLLASGRLRYLNRQGIRLERDADKLLDEAMAQSPDVIIFDSFDRLHRLGEQSNNSTAISSIFTDCLMPLAAQSGACILVLHHENKPPPPAKGKPVFRTFAQRSRGSGALAESADQGLILDVDPDDRTLKHLRAGGARSSSIAPGTTLCSFKIVDVANGIRIKSGPAIDPDGDDQHGGGDDSVPWDTEDDF